MNIPEELQPVLSALARHGRPFLVGGCVRDALLGLEPKDFDIEVYGVDWARLAELLAPFGPTDVVGRSFGVIKLRLGAHEYDIALPRRETKTSAGHRGFAIEPDANLDPRLATARRDFTINALLYDPIERRVVDPHGGAEDLKKRLLRHTSPAFVEDPLRVLRGFQLAARFDLHLAPETAALCASIHHSFSELPRERIWGEWDKWATKSVVPARGLAILKQTGWLAHFPQLAALDGLPQEPDWHPEGDVFTHVGHCLDALVRLRGWQEAGPAERRRLSFGVLAHDFGKAVTTERAERAGVARWISPGHDRAGGPLAEQFLEQIGSPVDLRAPVRALVENHHAHQSWTPEGPTESAVRRLARKIAPATLDELTLVMEADHLGRPPLVASEMMTRIGQLRAVAARLAVASEGPRPILQGRDLIELGLHPGPRFGPILKTAFEAQLDGQFEDHAGAMRWLSEYLGFARRTEELG